MRAWWINVVVVCILCGPHLLPVQGDDLAALKELLPRLKPTEPEDALATFRLERGFRIELVAAEPDVVDPIALAFDARGRMYVCEDRDYPYPAAEGERALGRVRLLEDTDGDGRYEKSVIFAENLHWPSGAACYNGGVFVAAPPQILYLKDADGDGRADVRKVVFDGFGTQAAEDIMNNLQWGLDNRIYGAASYNGGDVRRPNDESAEIVSVRGSSFRFDPRTLQFERLAGTGDFGNCFDDWGNRFVTNAGCILFHPVLAEPYIDRNPHLVVGSVLHRAAAEKRTMFSISPPEPWRVVRKKFWDRWVDTTQQMRASRFSEEELAVGGFVTGAAGAAIYRGDAFPPEYRGDSFTAEPAGNVVIRLNVKPDGVTFRARPTSKDREFLASTDNWFRPVNVVNGPDGCLYICDMYREIIEDPSAIPDDILKLVDVTAGRDRGRIYRIVPADFERQRLTVLDGLPVPRLVAALESRNGWERQTAQRLLVERGDESALKPLRDLLKNFVWPEARLHALWTLAGLDGVDEELALAALGDEYPAVREHAVKLAEQHLNRSSRIADRLVALAGDDHPRVRFQVAFSLGQWSDREAATESLATIARRDAADPWIAQAVLSSVPRDADALLTSLLGERDFAGMPAGQAMLAQIAEIVGTAGDEAAVTHVLNAILATDEPAPLLERLVVGRERRGVTLEALLKTQPAATRRRLDAMMATAEAVAADTDATTVSRIQSAALLRIAPSPAAIQVLGNLLSPREATELQLAAISSLSTTNDKHVGPLLIERWRDLTPAVRGEAAESLLRSPQRARTLLLAIRDGEIPRADLDPARQRALLSHANGEIRTLAEQVFSDTARPGRAEVIRQYEPRLGRAGNGERGGEVFRKNCATCHAVAGEGKHVGPDLASVEARSPEQLLLQILDPNREVRPQYQNYVAVTEDGRTFTGIIAEETASSITLRRAEGAQDVIIRSRLDELRSTGQSLMPEGLEKQITPQQMADLIDYLRNLTAQKQPAE